MSVPSLRVLASLFLLAAAPARSQDRLAFGTPSGAGPFIVPIALSDVAGTPLGVDRGEGSRIQSIAATVRFTPASAVASASLARAGLLTGRTPLFETTAAGGGTVTWLGAFDETPQPLPLSQPPLSGGDAVLLLTVALVPGASVTATLDAEGTTLSNQAGTSGETADDGSLSLGPAVILPLHSAPPPVPAAGVGGLVALASAVAAAGALFAKRG